MANQRPIRRAPFPRWKRGRRRPTRWIDGNSNQLATANCGTVISNLQCEPTDPRELLVGDLDIDWSDKNEVTIARIVGSIALAGNSVRTNSAGAPYHVLVRMGILVTEDTDRVYNAIDLSDPESLEEFEWMWLHQQVLDMDGFASGGDALGAETTWAATKANIPVDIRVKRKLGKKDSLVLFAQHALMSFVPNNFVFDTGMAVQLRTVLLS